MLDHFYYRVLAWDLLGIIIIRVWVTSRSFLGKFWLLQEKTSNDMDPLTDLNACSLLCLGKFSQSLQETHCNPPPQTFEITFITAGSFARAFSSAAEGWDTLICTLSCRV